MKTIEITMVRVYITEGKRQLQKIMACLHDEMQVRGVTVFRGIAGFGKSGRMHSSDLLDMSLDLPLVLEFFDQPDRLEPILEHIHSIVGPGHIVSWTANLNGE